MAGRALLWVAERHAAARCFTCVGWVLTGRTVPCCWLLQGAGTAAQCAVCAAVRPVCCHPAGA